MNHQIRAFIERLPKSPVNLTEDNTSRIHSLIPVPTDYKILWADILNFGGYPAGIVITKQGLVIKGTRDEVKTQNAKAKKECKAEGKKAKPEKISVIYRVIPWSLFNPEDYSVEALTSGAKEKRYILKTDNQDLAQLSSESFCNLFTSYKNEMIEQQRIADAIIENSTFGTINAANVEDVMFNAAYGIGHSKTGHGFYAEKAGVKLDKLHGEQSTHTGADCAKHGPDKIVARVPVQCKYCKTASDSVAAFLETDPATGLKTFKYTDLSGNPMKLEVASDQYVDALSLMQKKIRDGLIKDVTDPNKAYDIIRKGRISYKQARNLAKAGNIDSLRYDAASGAVTCLSAFGMTSLVAFAQVLWGTKDYKLAAKQALFSGLQVYGLSFVANVIASQISRTAWMNAAKPIAAGVGEFIGPKATQAIINAFRALAGKNTIYGAAAQKSFAKFIGANAITETVMLLVFSAPDTYRLIQGRMSKAQYFKNLTSLIASFLGSIGGTAAAGACIGEKLGSAINKKAGKALGLCAGMIAGAIAGAATKAIGNCFKEDDAIITGRLFNAVLINCIIEEMLTDDEQDELIKMLDEDSKGLKQLQASLLKSKTQEADIKDYLTPMFDKIKQKRAHIGSDEEQKMAECIEETITGGTLDEM